MNFPKTTLLSLCLAAASGMALAQNPNVRRGEYYVGIATNTPQCPAIRYLFRGVEENPVGYVWFADASGMSKATGTMNLASGRFHLTLTSLDGQGPLGEVDGTKDPMTGVVTAVLDGPLRPGLAAWAATACFGFAEADGCAAFSVRSQGWRTSARPRLSRRTVPGAVSGRYQTSRAPLLHVLGSRHVAADVWRGRPVPSQYPVSRLTSSARSLGSCMNGVS